jgi:hypothetical protein
MGPDAPRRETDRARYRFFMQWDARLWPGVPRSGLDGLSPLKG